MSEGLRIVLRGDAAAFASAGSRFPYVNHAAEAGIRFAVLYVGASQLVYLIGFSYAFFFPGWTGLSVVIIAVVTLFALMQATGRVNWFAVFGKPATPPPPLPATQLNIKDSPNIV